MNAAQDLGTKGSRLFTVLPRWRTVATALLAFLLPLLPEYLPFLSVVVLLLHVIDVQAWRDRFRFQIAWRSPGTWAMLFFLLHVLGMAWTTNTAFGWFDIGIKLPLLLFPVFAFFSGADGRARTAVLNAFCLGNALAALICLAFAAWRMIGPGGEGLQEFLSSRFSAMLHPSYFAWYLTTTLAVFFLSGVGDHWRPWQAAAFVLLTCAGIVLCEARMGWITLLVVLFWALVHGWGQVAKRRLVLGLLLLSVLAGGVLVATSGSVRWRVKELFTTRGDQPADAEGSAAIRTVVWRAAVDVGRWNLPLGTGTGDVKDELLLRYKEIGATHALERKLNAHDQFLQSFVALGVPGVAALALLFLMPLPGLLKRGQAMRACFLLLAAMNWSVESMLEVQAGALFTGFMLWVLWWPDDGASSSHT